MSSSCDRLLFIYTPPPRVCVCLTPVSVCHQSSPSVTTRSRRPAPAPAPAPAPTPAPAPAEGQRQATLRLATGRVQHEIQEATRRELELRGEGHTITTSEETVDDKVRTDR